MNNQIEKNSEEKRIFSEIPSEISIRLPFCKWKIYINADMLLNIAMKKIKGEKLTKVENIELKKFWVLAWMITFFSAIGYILAIGIISIIKSLI